MRLSSIYRVWQRNWLHFKKSWLVNFILIVIEPLFFLVALGYGLGSYVRNIGGVSFVEFYFPGLLCNTAVMVAFFETTYVSFSKLTFQRTYFTLMQSPIEPAEIAFADILWGATKGFLSAVGISAIAAVFGQVHSVMIVPALLVIFILAFLFSALGMIITSIVKNNDGIIYSASGFIIPMSLFSGAYFPVEQLPGPLKFLTYLLPLTHGVSVVRSLLLNFQFNVWFFVHILILVGLGFWGTKIAIRRIQKKLRA